jgi:hypothetical protein
VDILREQLQRAHERERAYQEHIAQLTAMLHETQQQNQRLMDMSRGAPVPAPGPGAPAAPRPHAATCADALWRYSKTIPKASAQSRSDAYWPSTRTSGPR